MARLWAETATFLLLADLSGVSDASVFWRCLCFGDSFTAFTDASLMRVGTYF